MWKPTRLIETKDGRLNTLLWSLILSGLGCLLVSAYLHLHHAQLATYISEIGIALVIAGSLGLTVDRYFKRGLVSDVFQTAFGYILHPDIRPELNSMFQLPVLCTEFTLDMELIEVPEGIRIKTRLSRTFENISPEPQEPLNDLSVDDYGVGKATAIAEFGWEADGTQWREYEESRSEFDLSAKFTKTPSLKRGETARVWAVFEHSCNLADDFTFFFRTATRNPIIKVKSPESLQHSLTFATREVAWSQEEEGTYRHSGTFLPMQAVLLRWRPKKKEAT